MLLSWKKPPVKLEPLESLIQFHSHVSVIIFHKPRGSHMLDEDVCLIFALGSVYQETLSPGQYFPIQSQGSRKCIQNYDPCRSCPKEIFLSSGDVLPNASSWQSMDTIYTKGRPDLDFRKKKKKHCQRHNGPRVLSLQLGLSFNYFESVSFLDNSSFRLNCLDLLCHHLN